MLTLFLNGFLHILQLPAQFLLLISLALYIGQQIKTNLAVYNLLFISAFSSGLVLSHFYSANWNENKLLLGSALLLGLITLLALKLPIRFNQSITLLGGLLLGLTVNPFVLPGFSLIKVLSIFLGVLSSGTLLFGIIMLIAFYLNRLWQGIGIRVLGSWIAAIALLVLALSFTALR